MRFSNSWFEITAQGWFIPNVPKLGVMKVLEIGSFEGRSACWLIENVPDLELYCVDTWEGSVEHSGIDMEAVFKTFQDNVMQAVDKVGGDIDVHIRRQPSKLALAELHTNGVDDFDLVYVDGSHMAADVLADAVGAWPLLKSGGHMIFDDYTWAIDDNPRHAPKLGVDAFVVVFEEQLDAIHAGSQFVVRKK